ncbi:lipopolysaccharide biosynthesis protein [Bradyrhizobium sp. CCBAU 53380]|uniref:lipopolysaccharide biosynthesis protein n=1 Tax=Bradyrhizobium sp. CCBAU 53380 TaxID=1325117 RepID=UPI002302DD2C|nr:teichoic acid transporter [Bradyrhizobium sp. CCBAU 53380]MDA9421471.1 teichoic acid transporter [Bradyrhizobium sp. CCBAU 53380]
MLRRFVHNTAISAVAYGLAGVLGLFAVGLIAKSYGLAVLGLIVLVRGFLPSGFLVLIDFGVSEIATQAIARGRLGDWAAAGEKISLLTAIAVFAGLASSIVLWLAAPGLALLFRVVPEQAQAFVSILRITALVLPIAFVGLMVEGALKGFEEYSWLRLTEVGSSVLYVGSIYLAFWQNAAFEWIAYAYLGGLAAKYFVLAFVVYLAARGTPLRFRFWTPASRRDVAYRCWLMFNNRIAGALQQTLIPLIIGALYGPVEVGTFDLLTRLPRFLKTTMSPLYSAILPISTHLDEKTDVRRLQLLGRNGLVLPAAIIVPILVVIGLFSEDILRVWVGPQHADQWPWLALALFVPAVTVMLGAGQTALMVRSDFLRTNTHLLYLQVLTQYIVTALAAAWLRERAFLLGWAISYVLFAPVVAHRMLSLMSLPNLLFWQQLGRHVLVAAILAAMAAGYKMYAAPATLLALTLVGGLACIAAWALSIGLILSRSDRAMVGKFARALTPR